MYYDEKYFTMSGLFIVWVIVGLTLFVSLLILSDSTVIIKIKNTVMYKGLDIMVEHTISGFKKDMSNVVDKLAIRFINLLDYLRGTYNT